MNWREYHEWTKHTAERLQRSPHFLDWANMPDAFREYEGVPVLDLPADPPAPETPALEVLRGRCGSTPAADGATFLSELLFYSAAISATKVAPSTGSVRIACESLVGQSAPDRVPFRGTRAEGVAGRTVPLPRLGAYG